MILRKVEKKDYPQLVVHAKNVCNYYSFFNNYNDELNTKIGEYLLNHLLETANYGLVIEYNEIIIGVLLANVLDDNRKLLFDKYTKEMMNITEIDLDNYVCEDANQEAIKQLELFTGYINQQMYQKYVDLIKNKNELLMFSILPNHRGRGLGELLMKRFKFDIIELKQPEYYLYTTTICSYQYYEHKKMQSVKEIIYDQTNANEEIKKIIDLPMYGIIYYTNALYDKNYDPIAEVAIIENNNQQSNSIDNKSKKSKK